MKVHEYQARQILADAGIPVPAASVIESASDARGAYESSTRDAGTDLAVVKAQSPALDIGLVSM